MTNQVTNISPVRIAARIRGYVPQRQTLRIVSRSASVIARPSRAEAGFPLDSLSAADEYRARELEAQRRDTQRRQAVLDSLLEGRVAEPDQAAEARRALELPDTARLAVVVIRHRPTYSSPPSPGVALATSCSSGWRSSSAESEDQGQARGWACWYARRSRSVVTWV